MQYPLHLHLGIEVSDADFWSIQEGGGGVQLRASALLVNLRICLRKCNPARYEMCLGPDSLRLLEIRSGGLRSSAG